MTKAADNDNVSTLQPALPQQHNHKHEATQTSTSDSNQLSLQSMLAQLSNVTLSKSLLSDKAILKHMSNGNIIISPFNMTHLSTSSYDVTLGPFYYRENDPEPAEAVYNPYSETQVRRVWGKAREAEVHSEWLARTGITLENIAPTDRIIWLKPGETILGHTNEFIGGKETVTTMMKARSSLGRNFIEVCKCAGWGDIGYVNRWTMEITNNSRYYSIPLVVGRRIAQIVFFDTDGTVQFGQLSYERTGKYQTTAQIEELRQRWKPEDMLPKMYLDREVKRIQQQQRTTAIDN